MATPPPHFRLYQPGDEPGAYYVCLKTGDNGQDGETFYREDPDALGRIYVGPYFVFEPDLALILEDGDGVCGYALGAFDSHAFFARYEADWRPKLCAEFPEPKGDAATWSRVQAAHHLYHQPDYFCPEPYEQYPSHIHIDLLEHARGKGWGRKMVEQLLQLLHQRRSPGVHLGMSAHNAPAHAFYERLGFRDLVRIGKGEDASIYMGQRL